MKRNLLFGFFVVCAAIANAQSDLYVSNGSYVYVKDQVVTVVDDINLPGANSMIYLRDNAQLIQKNSAAGTNTGLGALSVFQEGTANHQYDYDSWCLPVGKSDATMANSINNRLDVNQLIRVPGGADPLVNNGTTTFSAWGDYQGLASAGGNLKISSRWLWKFVSDNVYADWQHVGPGGTTLQPGEGFLMKGTDGSDGTSVYTVANKVLSSKQRYDFRGKPNSGTISVSVAPGSSTLTGNPYPSALDVDSFILGNAAGMTGTVYYYDHNGAINSHYLAAYQAGYGSYVPGSYAQAVYQMFDGSGNPISTPGGNGALAPGRYAPIGQGFFVDGKAAGSGNVQFLDSYRSYTKEAGGTSVFTRSADNSVHVANGDINPEIHFNILINGQFNRDVVLTSYADATDGLDYARDGYAPVDGLPADAYFKCEAKNLVIQSVNFDKDKKLPLEFANATSQATYKIWLNTVENFDAADEIYIHDKETNMYYDIKNGFFDVTLPAGVNNTRFEMVFRNGLLSNEDFSLTDLDVFQNNSGNMLTIKNPRNFEIASCSMYDLAGKLIISKQNLGTNSSYEFPTNNLSTGIYAVELTSKEGKKINKKVIVDRN